MCVFEISSTHFQSSSKVAHLSVALSNFAISNSSSNDIIEHLRERQLLPVLWNGSLIITYKRTEEPDMT